MKCWPESIFNGGCGRCAETLTERLRAATSALEYDPVVSSRLQRELIHRKSAFPFVQAILMGNTNAGDLVATRQVEARSVPIRWAILHVINNTALHLGHMQITYQLWQGGRAYNAPRWYQRLDRSSRP